MRLQVGWGAADYLAYYEDFGANLPITSVIVFLNTDDIGRAFKSSLYKISTGPELNRSDPISRQGLKSVLSQWPIYGWLLEHSHLLQALRTAVVMVMTQPAASSAPATQHSNRTPHSVLMEAEIGPAVEHGKKLFARLKQLSVERGHKLVVVTTGWQAFSEQNKLDPSMVFFEEAASFFAKLGIHFIDRSMQISKKTGSDPEPYMIKADHHPNAAGARVIADSVYPDLRSFLLNR